MDVVFLEKGAKLSDFLQLYAQQPNSRYPVFENARDNVVGIISIYDVLASLAKGEISPDSVIDNLIRPAYFTPESKPISELLSEMRDNNFQMAVVIDEFGGTAGVVSFNHLVEEIVGPVGDGVAG